MTYLEKSPECLPTSRRVHAAGLLSYGNNTFGALIQAVEPDREKKVSTLHKTILPGGRYLTADDGKRSSWARPLRRTSA